MSNIVIGCKLPNGLIVKGSNGQDVEIFGVNRTLIAGATFGVTRLDESEADYIFAIYGTLAPFANESIFRYADSDNVADIAALAVDLSDVQTGFEGMNPDAPAASLKPSDETAKSLDELKGAAAATPRRAPKTKESKAAAAELAAVIAN